MCLSLNSCARDRLIDLGLETSRAVEIWSGVSLAAGFLRGALGVCGTVLSLGRGDDGGARVPFSGLLDPVALKHI